MEEYICKTLDDTKRVAQMLAARIIRPTVIAYFGDLGAGKTTFTRFFCEALDVTEEVTSPTFAMVHEYRGRLPVYHFDMYRVQSFEDLYSTGYFDYLGTGVLLIEWSENIERELPNEYIRITLDYGETETERVIRVEEIE